MHKLRVEIDFDLPPGLVVAGDLRQQTAPESIKVACDGIVIQRYLYLLFTPYLAMSGTALS